MATKIPYTNTFIGEADEFEELRIPHTLDILAGVRAHYGALQASVMEIQRLLGDDSDPLNKAVAHMLCRSVLRELEELRKFAEIG